jgi:hypothetical protein
VTEKAPDDELHPEGLSEVVADKGWSPTQTSPTTPLTYSIRVASSVRVVVLLDSTKGSPTESVGEKPISISNHPTRSLGRSSTCLYSMPSSRWGRISGR